jgi:hypothetical protein
MVDHYTCLIEYHQDAEVATQPPLLGEAATERLWIARLCPPVAFFFLLIPELCSRPTSLRFEMAIRSCQPDSTPTTWLIIARKATEYLDDIGLHHPFRELCELLGIELQLSLGTK